LSALVAATDAAEDAVNFGAPTCAICTLQRSTHLNKGGTHTMRKGVILLVAALLFSLAAPAFAAVEVGGKLGSKFTLERVADKWQVRGNTGLEVETSFTADGGNPVKAVVQLEPWNLNNAGFDDDGNPIGEFDMTG